MGDEKVSPFLVFIAVIAVAVSLFSLGLIYLSANTLFSQISGRVTNGETNLTVNTQTEINFTTRAIGWGNGRVNQDANSASLTTFATNNVTGGNWTLTTAGGLRIENIGNVNVTLNLSVAKTAVTFIGGTSPVYQWNLTNVEAASCLNSSQQNMSDRMNSWFTATSANTGNLWCDVFPFNSAKDTVRVDFNITVPENSLTGALGDIITATVTAL